MFFQINQNCAALAVRNELDAAHEVILYYPRMGELTVPLGLIR